MEKNLELRVRAIIGPEMARLQQELRNAGLLGAQVGKNAAMTGQQVEQGFQRGNRAAKDFNNTIQNSARYLTLIKGVISAFLLYRGFSFLSQEAAVLTRRLVDVQHQVGIIQTQLRDTGKDFRSDITRNILRTAGETGMTMESLARTEYEIVSANIELADSYKVLDLSARAAVAGGLQDAELAFDAALSQVNAFGISFEKAFDLQFQTLKRGVFNYGQFTTVVGTLSEAFASMGQDAETANASLAAISQVFTGKQIERGATGLRNAVLRISEAQEDFEKLGVSVTTAAGDFRNFIGIGEDLNKVLSGMSESQRATVLKGLFPDERERRGIAVFLGQLDQAEQFYVEQQFAVDSLNDAYQTANDSLLTQARIFEQNLTPAMEPFVEMMSGLLGIFNTMDKMLPGLNSSLLTTATVASVIGGGMLMSGSTMTTGKYRMATPYFGSGPMGMGRSPTGFGIAASSLIPITAFMGAKSGGAQRGDYIGSLISGTAAGAALGGLPGAAIGAAITVAATAFGSALADEAPPVSKSFSDRFSEALKASAGDVATAFTEAIANNVEIAPGVPLFQALTTGGQTKFTGSKADFRRELEAGRLSVDLQTLQRAGLETMSEQRALGLTNAELKQLYNDGRVSLRSDMNIRGTIPGAMMNISPEFARGGLSTGFGTFATRASDLAQFQGNENYGPALQALAVQSFEEVFGKDSEVARGAADFAVKMFESGKSAEVFTQAIEAASRGDFKEFLQLTGQIDDAAHEVITTFEVLAGRFNDMFTGDADALADVFQHMGTEGEKLAEVFHSIGRTMQAFSTLETLQSMSIRGGLAPDVNKLAGELNILSQKRAQLAYELESGTNGPDARLADLSKMDAEIADYQARIAKLPTFEQKNLLESLGIDSNAATQMLLDRLIADLGLVQGDFTTQEFVNALFADIDEEEVQDILELGANDFADALFTIAHGILHGFFDSETGLPKLFDTMGYTADQLEMFAEEFEVLNRLVRQKALLEQLKGIADFAGVGDKGIQGAMDILRAEMVASGKALFDLLSDPASLAELIAKMEFGDVTVDNSKDYNFVIRISGDDDLNTANAANFARQVVQLINEDSRRSLS